MHNTLKTCLTPWTPQPGQTHVIGNLVSLNGTGILITGKPGSGKSLLTFLFILKGAHFIADDLILLNGNIGHRKIRAPLLYIRGIGFLNLNHLFAHQAIPACKIDFSLSL